MKKYVKNHEQLLKTRMTNGTITPEFIMYHKDRIKWLQHERLVHLMVFLFTVMMMVTFFVVTLWFEMMLLYILLGILLSVSFAYCLHYYYLENTVQKWYQLADQLEKQQKL